MKQRYCFVSNSSSSSFVVNIYNDWFKKEENDKAITLEQQKLLEEYGFKCTNATLLCIQSFEGWPPSQCFDSLENPNGVSYGFYVACNQDYVIEFLVKNRIPFHALVHYGHESMLYDGKSDEVDVFQNFGIRAGMYGLDSHDLEYPPHERIKYPIEYPIKRNDV